MLFLNNCIFIHIPKTGGTSLCHYVLKSVVGGDCLEKYDNHLSTREGWKHAKLRTIYARKDFFDLDPEEIRHVTVMFRNPYDKMVSLYYFSKQYLSQLLQKSAPDQFKAMQLPFCEWVVALKKIKRKYTWESYEKFIALKDGTLPSNLIVLRYEDYAPSVRSAVELFGGKIDKTIELGRAMETRRTRDWMSLYTQESEEAVYLFHKWVFDNGYYERMKT